MVWRVKREGSGKKEKMRDRERETDRQGDWVRGGSTESCSYLLKYSCWCQQLFHSPLSRGLLFDTSIALSLAAPRNPFPFPPHLPQSLLTSEAGRW